MNPLNKENTTMFTEQKKEAREKFAVTIDDELFGLGSLTYFETYRYYENNTARIRMEGFDPNIALLAKKLVTNQLSIIKFPDGEIKGQAIVQESSYAAEVGGLDTYSIVLSVRDIEIL
jgi:hypothetical protein